MKLNLLREELLPALQTVSGVVEKRQTLPILSNLLLVTSNDRITLTATDMEVELIAVINKTMEDAGEVTLSARKLLDICRALPEQAIMRLNTDGDRVVLTSGKSRFMLSTQPAQEYPLIEMADKILEFSVSQSNFKALLERTAFAMAQQDVRYYLNGLLLELEKNRLRAVATDGHRLALCDTEIEGTVVQPIQIIVPRKGVTELVKLLQEEEENINVQISANHIRIDLGNLRYTSKLIDGKFPDYVRVIPEENKHPVFADKGLLRQSLTRASILSNEKYRGVRLFLEQGVLRALAHNPEQEEAEEEIEVDYDGDVMEIGFNVSYLLDALAIIETERVKISISDPNSSCLLMADAPSACKFVVMPMRL
ncbi:MAG: DNA polymerase III subunit beta [Gammaproteobacteria bacterium]